MARKFDAEWSQFKGALGVFANDYSLVNAGGTPFASPFDRPNGGQYSIVQVPSGMTESDFRRKLEQRPVFAISCMDKRFVGPVHDQLERWHGDDSVTMLSFGGGPVQSRGIRFDALSVVTGYLSERAQPERVYVVPHDGTCGAVKHFIGKSLPDVLGVAPAHPREGNAMKGLTLQRLREIGLGRRFCDSEVRPVLAHIEPNGEVKLDDDFAGTPRLTLRGLLSQ